MGNTGNKDSFIISAIGWGVKEAGQTHLDGMDRAMVGLLMVTIAMTEDTIWAYFIYDVKISTCKNPFVIIYYIYIKISVNYGPVYRFSIPFASCLHTAPNQSQLQPVNRAKRSSTARPAPIIAANSERGKSK